MNSTYPQMIGVRLSIVWLIYLSLSDQILINEIYLSAYLRKFTMAFIRSLNILWHFVCANCAMLKSARYMSMNAQAIRIPHNFAGV